MNTITTHETIDQVKDLISFSIINKNTDESNFHKLHRALVKRYFDAKHINIDYQAQTIDLKLPVGQKKYTQITFECQDIERFLKSCLKKDDKSLFFYQTLLDHYKVTSAA